MVSRAHSSQYGASLKFPWKEFYALLRALFCSLLHALSSRQTGQRLQPRPPSEQKLEITTLTIEQGEQKSVYGEEQTALSRVLSLWLWALLGTTRGHMCDRRTKLDSSPLCDFYERAQNHLSGWSDKKSRCYNTRRAGSVYFASWYRTRTPKNLGLMNSLNLRYSL